MTKMNIAEREKIYEEVIDYYNQGYNQTEIAQKLGLAKSTISLYVSKLKEEGRLTDRRAEQKNKMLEKIIGYYNQGITNDAIARMLGVSSSTIGVYISELREDERISKKRPHQNDLPKKIKKLYMQGDTTKEIAEKLCVAEYTVKGYITRLKRDRKLPEKKPRKESSKDRVLRLCKKGLTRKEIAKTLGIADSSVRVFISKLRAEGKIDEPEIAYGDKETRQKRVVWLYNHGVSQSDIARTLEFAYCTITRDVQELRENGTISLTQRQMDITEVLNEIKANGYPKQDVRFLIDFYTKKGLYTECINLLQEYAENKDMSEEKRKTIGLIQEKLDCLRKKQEKAPINIDNSTER